MSELNYIIYSNISDDTFLSIREALIPIENSMLNILRLYNWTLHSPVIKSDALIVDFIKNDSEYHGNMGIKFDDKPNKITFTFYITKSFHENGFRYFYKTDIFEGKELEFFEDRISDFTELCLTTYEGITKENIISSGDIIKLSNYKGV